MPELELQIAGWAPQPVERADGLDPTSGGMLHDLLGSGGAPRPGDPVDALHHWAYFQDWPPLASLGPDGHPRSSGFLPPLRDRRRMIAGGRCWFHAPLYYGRPAVAVSELGGHTVKRGRSGELLFVTVRTTITQDGRSCVVDEQDVVYRSGPDRPAADRPPADGPLTGAAGRPCAVPDRRVCYDPVTLFRFSALTANSHRIHYDQPYARDVEGFPGLVVHGPLLVLAMTQVLSAAEQAQLTDLSYRLHRPVFSGEPVDVSRETDGSSARFTVTDPTGGLHASARARFLPWGRRNATPGSDVEPDLG